MWLVHRRCINLKPTGQGVLEEILISIYRDELSSWWEVCWKSQKKHISYDITLFKWMIIAATTRHDEKYIFKHVFLNICFWHYLFEFFSFLKPLPKMFPVDLRLSWGCSKAAAQLDHGTPPLGSRLFLHTCLLPGPTYEKHSKDQKPASCLIVCFLVPHLAWCWDSLKVQPQFKFVLIPSLF